MNCNPPHPSVLIYEDSRNKVLLWLNLSILPKGPQRTVNIRQVMGEENQLPPEQVRPEARGTNSEHRILHGGVHPENEGRGPFSKTPQITQEVAFKFSPNPRLERCC